MPKDLNDSFYSDQDSDTVSNTSTELNELDDARFENTDVKYLTPYKTTEPKGLKKHADSSMNNATTAEILLRTQSNFKDKISNSQQSIEYLASKYPKEVRNTKRGTVSVKKHNHASTCNYENVCSICLDTHSDIRGLLKCGHKFCYECLNEWTKASTKCPCCRKPYSEIVKITVSEKIERKREMVKVEEKQMEYNELDYYICYGCNRGDDEDVLLICDMCDFYCCHVYCDASLSNIMPEDEWFCRHCKLVLEQTAREQRQREAQVPASLTTSDRENDADEITTVTNIERSPKSPAFSRQGTRTQTQTETQTQDLEEFRCINFDESEQQEDKYLNQVKSQCSKYTSQVKTRAMQRKQHPSQYENEKFNQRLKRTNPQNPSDYPELVDNLMSTGMRLRQLRRRRL